MIAAVCAGAVYGLTFALSVIALSVVAGIVESDRNARSRNVEQQYQDTQREG